jgi:hypothetical protein
VTIDDRTFEVRNGVAVETTGRIVDPSANTVVWPGDGTAVPLIAYGGAEWPDPLSSCKGWTKNSGLPIYLMRGAPTEVAEATLVSSNGKNLPICILSAQTFRGRDAGSQQTGRAVLDGYGAVVLFPKSPLAFGQTYQVNVQTTDGAAFKWSFSTVVNEIRPAAGHPLAGQPTPGKSSQQPKR